MSYKMTPEEANKWLQKNNMPPLYRKAEPSIIPITPDGLDAQRYMLMQRLQESLYNGLQVSSDKLGFKGIVSHYTGSKE